MWIKFFDSKGNKCYKNILTGREERPMRVAGRITKRIPNDAFSFMGIRYNAFTKRSI